MSIDPMTENPLASKAEIERQLRIELATGERLLWSGIPRQGILLKRSDALAIPFSLLWGGFAIFWESSAWATKAPWFFKLWGIPFVLIGLYMMVGRFFTDAAMRKRTYYGVTDQRILIVSGFRSRDVKSLSLRGTDDITLSEKVDGSGSVTFGAGMGLGSASAFDGGWPGSSRKMAPAFDPIDSARKVYELIRKTQREGPIVSIEPDE